MLSIKRQSGVSLFLAVITMTVLLAIVLGLSTIFLSQTVMIREMGNSVIAFYAANTGIEKVLMQRGNPSGDSGTLGNGASYEILVSQAGQNGCPPASININYCIKSIGKYHGVSRAIEITY